MAAQVKRHDKSQDKKQTDTQKIFYLTLSKIKPEEDHLLKIAEQFISELNKTLKAKRVQADAVLGGSVAKGTYLKNDCDCDIFVRFDKKYPDEKLSDLLECALADKKPERIHGSRDYFHIEDTKNNIRFEIVPVLSIKDPKDARNVTDMSPLHVEWVRKNPRYTDDIRLAKQFCKAAGVYGAESFIRGFSGHVLDILVINYGGFMNLLSAATTWKFREVIDVKNHYAGSALKRLNPSKTESAIIVIDPVLPERNASAALSKEKLEKFVKAADQFMTRPDIKFFEIIPKTPEKIRQQAGKKKLLLFSATPTEGKTDVIGAKLLWVFSTIRRTLEESGFRVVEADWAWDKKNDALYWYILKEMDIETKFKREGPPISQKTRVEEFKKKHKKTFVEDGRVSTYVTREYTNAKKLLEAAIKRQNVLEKVSKIMFI
jgi:tRNA nucleotidyltransferase (CCA-adding enzyme)